MATYIALIHKDPDSDFGVSFPDFPGCFSAGSTLEEARSMAEEALDLHIRSMLEDGEDIPKPSSLDTIMADPENRDGGIPVLVLSTLPNAPRAFANASR
jgi:predicted RNase H-like HicB family nuclease